jgi:hypothetical protein
MRLSKGEASKAKLTQAAEVLFAEKGFHATTVSAIVKQAGLTQAAFYLYFKSKEQLLADLLEQFENELFPYANAGSQVKQQAADELEPFVIQSLVELFRVLGRNSHLTRIALQDTEAGDRLRQHLVWLIAGNMQVNQTAGLVRTDLAPELFAEAVIAAAERLIYRYGITGEKTAEELGHQLGSLYLHGMLVHRPMHKAEQGEAGEEETDGN